ncbi:MAG: hypothetical protein ABIH99_00085 [Candidatus Micrarchaeota archaeon]
MEKQETVEQMKTRLKELFSKENGLRAQGYSIVNRRRSKQVQLKALKTVVGSSAPVSVGRARRNLEDLEFKIATEAYTPKKEKELIKHVKNAEKKLEEVKQQAKMQRKVGFVDGDVRKLDEELKKVEVELMKVENEIKTLKIELNKRTFDERMKERRKQRRREDEENRKLEIKQLGINTEKIDRTVSMSDICVIKKKGEEKA